MQKNRTRHMPANSGQSRLNRPLCSIIFLLSIFSSHVYAPPVSTATPSSTSQAAAITAQQLTKEQSDAKLYQQTLISIKKGHRTNTEKGLRELKHYPLYPYLVKAKLERQLNKLPYNDVDQFLGEYTNTVAANQLRQRWLLTLAKKKQWKAFLHYYQPHVAGNQLHCHRLEALHQQGLSKISLAQTADIWLSGDSLPDACNNVFKRWQNSGLKTDELVWQRTLMALEKNNTRLARYLSKHASAYLKPYTRRLISVHRNPDRLSKFEDFQDTHPNNVAIVSHGLKRLAPRDRIKTSELWVSYRGSMPFTQQQFSEVRNLLARQYIASGDNEALNWLITHDPNAEDQYLLEWRIRLALKQDHWQQAGTWIGLLTKDLQEKPRWRYWLARAYMQKPETWNLATKLLQKLSLERNYYGFLAADFTGLNYDFNHQSLPASNTHQLSQSPSLKRAKAFYQMKKYKSARGEWRQLVSHLDEQSLVAATLIAHSWGWHQQAIQTTIKANHWNDLDVRFPLAFLDKMTSSANDTTINLEWLYAIARQESAFAQDARSSADARGLLQLLPRTAKDVAQTIGMPFYKKDLYTPSKNIQLGSNYLKQLLTDFEGSQILATAAYNAGPKRVKRWLSRQGANMTYDLWIETLPFHETRNYVQNVLAFSVIYGKKLGVERHLVKPTDTIIYHRPLENQ